MALSLSASKESVKDLFSSDIVYKIPEYQRAYSWDKEQCNQMYLDIIEAFNDNQRDYFLGNLVLAKSSKPKCERLVVDGQQRLTTLWIIMKIISLLAPELNPSKDALSVKAREGDEKLQRMQYVDEKTLDHNDINTLLNLTIDNIDTLRNRISANNRNKKSRIISNFFELYDSFVYFFDKYGKDQSKDLFNYIFDGIFLLPIELYNDDIETAENEALDIFETINNRGMNLQDADIFKSKIYKRALGINKQDDFINKWKEFCNRCDEGQYLIDDIFRFYSYIIRGRNGITSGEKKLRDLFLKETYSPILTKPYNEIMDDLFKILDICEYIQGYKSCMDTDIGKWIFLVTNYSNNLPFSALVVYLFENDHEDDNATIMFCKKLVRYSYSQGATFSIKFVIYSIMADICSNRTVKAYYLPEAYIVNNPGRLQQRLMYLYYVLTNKEIVRFVTVDKVIYLSDFDSVFKDWEENDKILYYSFGNLVLTDKPNTSRLIKNRFSAYKNSAFEETRQIFSKGISSITPTLLRERENKIKNVLNDFFCERNDK